MERRENPALVAAQRADCYPSAMTVFVPIRDLEKELASVSRQIAAGERVVVTKDGEPVFDLKPYPAETEGGWAPEPPKKGIDLEAGRARLAALGVSKPFQYVAPDFDEPLPEDFLIRPLPLEQ